MPLSIEYTIFADKSLEEKATGKISLIGIFEAINSGLPILPTMAMYCLVKGDPGVYKFKIHIRHSGPGSEQLKSSLMPELPLEFTIPKTGMAQVVLNFVGLPIVGNKIEFDIYQENELLKTASIPVIKQEGVEHARHPR